MHETRKSVEVWLSLLLFLLVVGAAHAGPGSTDVITLDASDQPATESLVATDLIADLSFTEDLESAEAFEKAGEPNCDSETPLATLLGIESALSDQAFSWTCGSCSIGACANQPVGTPCGFGRYCVVTTICSAQPLTERCVCGTDHF